MKLILYRDPFAITEIDFVPGPFRFQIELGHLDFAVARNFGLGSKSRTVKVPFLKVARRTRNVRPTAGRSGPRALPS